MAEIYRLVTIEKPISFQFEDNPDPDEDSNNHPPDLFVYKLHPFLCHKYYEEAVPDCFPTGNNQVHAKILAFDWISAAKTVDVNRINEVNKKGETTLHLKALYDNEVSDIFLEMLLENAANVNAQNIWGQSALHYSSFVSLAKIKRLVSTHGINVNIQDINGFNAIHCLLTSNSDKVPAPKAIDLMIEAGTMIEAQTKYGNTILHLAAEKKGNTPILKYIISKFSKKGLYIKNKFGENFLHIYGGVEYLEDMMDIFSYVENKKGVLSLQKLLNDQNKMGRTPWNIMIDNVTFFDKITIDESAMKKILRYGVNVSIKDSLGNTALHRIAGVSAGIMINDVLEVLTNNYENIHTKNIFGEPPCSMLFLQEDFDVFLKHQMNFNSKDRWERDSLVSIMKQHPIPDLLRAVITEGKVDVNSRDIYGNTPLHFAAYNNFPEQVKLLLEYGADIHARDELEETPLDTCIRHCSYNCLDILQEFDGQFEEIIYSRERSIHNILQSVPRLICSSKIKSSTDVKTTLRLPEDTDSFLSDLLNTYYTKSLQHFKEMKEVNKSVSNLVKGLCTVMNKYDTIFKLSVHPTGSMSEGTKVGRPDEFDFVVSFDEIVKLTKVVLTERCAESYFVCLQFTESPVREKYLSFSDKDGFFLAFPVLQYFFRYFKQALNESHLWKEGNLYYNFEDSISIIDGKPVFSFEVFWVGSVYKQLKISIDIVPGVYIPGFWPQNVDASLYHPDGNVKASCHYGIKLMTKNIRAAGCFLIFQTKNQDFDKKKYSANDIGNGDHINDVYEMKKIMKKHQGFENMKYSTNDNISITCNVDDTTEGSEKRRMLRVSAAPAEICLMNSLPEKFRQAYALAKIIKSQYVCPVIELDDLPTVVCSWQETFKNKPKYYANPYNKIKSYMLKNCLFYIYHEMSAKKEIIDDITVPQITAKMYFHLLYLADEKSLRPYFLPNCDVFELGEIEDRKSYKGFMFLLMRELSIKLVLGILNYPFPNKCLADAKKKPNY